MNQRATYLAGGLIALAVLVVGFAHLSAQRFPGPEAIGGAGRYVVACSSPDVIILLDTATGDLYNATPREIKPYASRPRPGGPGEGLGTTTENGKATTTTGA